MKPEMITLKHGDTTIKMPASSLAKLALASTFAVAFPPAANVQLIESPGIPPLGEYWPGEGGINGGPVPAYGDIPAHYLIFASTDVGEHEWGGRSKESAAIHKRDGKSNTAILLEGNHPAAKVAVGYTADGHSDFYLGSATEMHQAWANDVITSGVRWTSTQRSANVAFVMLFDDGYQGNDDKDTELLVRPVRRKFI